MPAPDGEPLIKSGALVEHVNAMVNREDVAYKRVKAVLVRRGYSENDFELGGILHGYSINELLDMVKED